MLLIITLQIIIVATLVRASRDRLENAFPFVCFFLVLMPLEARLVVPGVCDFNTMRLILITLLALNFSRGEQTESGPLPLKGLMVLHVLWAICSTVYSLSVATSAKQLLSQVLEYYLLYFLLVRNITSINTLRNMLFGIAMAMALCSCFSILEVYKHWSILRIFPSNLWITYNGGVDPLYIEWGRGLRARSTFPHPILFGDALAMSIPITLYLISIWERRGQRILLWCSLALMFWAIYKTSSRGPWMATGFCCLALFFFVRNQVRTYLFTLVLIVAVVLVARPGIWSTIDGLYTASTDASSPVGSSYLYRDTLNASVKAAVAKEPGRALLGYGLGTFRELGLDITFLGETHRWYTCDNNWAAFLYETGYVGLLIIGALLFRAAIVAVQNYRSIPEPDNYLSGVIFIALGGFYFLLMSVAGYSWGQQGYLSWILISIAVSHSRLAHTPFETELSGDELTLPVLELVSLAAAPSPTPTRESAGQLVSNMHASPAPLLHPDFTYPRRPGAKIGHVA